MNESDDFPTHDDIARVAYKFWEEEGRLDGQDVVHWERAVAHLLQYRDAIRAAEGRTGEVQARESQSHR